MCAAWPLASDDITLFHETHERDVQGHGRGPARRTEAVNVTEPRTAEIERPIDRQQDGRSVAVLPFSRLVGQADVKLALELAYVAPRLGGVLISGHRGTGKSTAVRSFGNMLYGRLPVTLPINATE